jgi:hypothetical protein
MENFPRRLRQEIMMKTKLLLNLLFGVPVCTFGLLGATLIWVNALKEKKIS